MIEISGKSAVRKQDGGPQCKTRAVARQIFERSAVSHKLRTEMLKQNVKCMFMHLSEDVFRNFDNIPRLSYASPTLRWKRVHSFFQSPSRILH